VPFVDPTEARKHVRSPDKTSRQVKVKVAANRGFRTSARSRQDPRLAADIRAIVEPHTYADPELKSPRRYTNLSAAEVRDALIAKGYSPTVLPGERTMRDILNRMNSGAVAWVRGSAVWEFVGALAWVRASAS
jgi:Rhodopirellula transposase DDE domain